MTRLIACPQCYGLGRHPSTDRYETVCNRCYGLGVVVRVDPIEVAIREALG